ncbi:integrase [Inhella inkyongensis]|uniref:Integrase n=1 Tax=Inhella inkyongensis TaxID=392593 RepID=A0A840S2G3_9BURK|nr:integrase arm-type DNA-binding domain-containing protein [Inhella inkyongensis]MBB5203933.1 integrase [Inhella inkyongensis]
MARDLIPGDKTLKAIKQGDPRKRISDGDGLYLLLFVKGGAHGWRFDYSFGGKRKTLSLGTYPDTSLSLARDKANEARKLLAAGTDPSDARKQAKAESQAQGEAQAREKQGLPALGSFEAVAREWWQEVHCAKVSESHAARTLVRLEQDAFPWIGSKPIAELKAADVLACAQRVVQRGAIETAHRLKDACGQVFRYGVAKSLCERNPVPDLRDALPPVPARHLASITEPAKVAELLRALQSYQGQPITQAALQLSPLLFLRPGELRHLEWAWIDWEQRCINIPAALMKRNKADKATGAPHWVPLANQALTVLETLKPLTGAGRFLFPALTTDSRPMSENTVRSALRRLGYGNEDMTAHGFRAMARTMADEQLGVPVEVIEAQLAHAVADSLGRAYNRTQFLAHRRELMQRWADYLDKLRQGAEVLPFKAA